MTSRATTTIALVVALSIPACGGYAADVERAEAHYHANRYISGEVLLLALERDIDSLSEAEKVRYAYLRGMTAYRLGRHLDARHWLARARARSSKAPDSLDPLEHARVARTLDSIEHERVPKRRTRTESKPTGESPCTRDTDCPGAFCDDGTCRQLTEPKLLAAPAAAAAQPTPTPSRAASSHVPPAGSSPAATAAPASPSP